MDKSTSSTRHVSALERIRNAAENKYVRVGSAVSIGLGSLSLAGCADPTPPAEPQPTSVVGEPSPEAPTETPDTVSEFTGIPTVESLQMSAELGPEEVASHVTDIISSWNSAGANQENFDLRYEGDNGLLSQPEYIQKIVDAAIPVYAEALYGSDWQNPEFADSIQQVAGTHFRTLGAYFTTQGPEFSAPYTRDEKLFAVRNINQEGNVTSMEIVIEYSDNGPEIGTDYTINGLKSSARVSVEPEGNRLILNTPLIFEAA